MPTYKITAFKTFEFVNDFEITARSFSAAEDKLREIIEYMDRREFVDWELNNSHLELQVEDKRDAASPH